MPKSNKKVFKVSTEDLEDINYTFNILKERVDLKELSSMLFDFYTFSSACKSHVNQLLKMDDISSKNPFIKMLVNGRQGLAIDENQRIHWTDDLIVPVITSGTSPVLAFMVYETLSNFLMGVHSLARFLKESAIVEESLAWAKDHLDLCEKDRPAEEYDVVEVKYLKYYDELRTKLYSYTTVDDQKFLWIYNKYIGLILSMFNIKEDNNYFNYDELSQIVTNAYKILNSADEINDLKNQIEESKKSKDSQVSLAEKNISRYESQIEELHEEIRELENTNQDLRDDLDEAYQEILDKSQTIKKQEQEIERFKDQKQKDEATIQLMMAQKEDTLEDSPLNHYVYDDKTGSFTPQKNFTEMEFLNYLEYYVHSEGLFYDKKDLYNFHLACKSSPLTILAGASGMGKTQLPLAYAHCINATEKDHNLLFLPISPSYTEPSDVLGFYNVSQNRYVPADTGLVALLKHAQDHPEQNHMVIFDEMNLSQIEYWFAPFMSVLEKPLSERKITLYDESLKDETYPSALFIGQNVIFVGTINLDETTKDMSDRLIDRAIVLNLKKQSFKDYKKSMTSNSADLKPVICQNYMEYASMRPSIQNDYIKNLTDSEASFFDELHNTLQSINAGKCVSFRNVKKISLYLLGLEGIDDLSRSEAFDYIFKQTILKKINGYDESIREILGSLDEEGTIVNSRLKEVLVKYPTVSNFTHTLNDIKNKIKEFDNYGFTK